MDKKLLGLITLFFLSFLFFISVILFNKPLTEVTRAKEDAVTSSENSLIFAWPITAKADGQSEVTINVFVRSENNRLIPGKSVSVTSTLGQIKTVSNISDKNGKTTFVLTSDSPGNAEIGATVDSTTSLSKKLTIKFE